MLRIGHVQDINQVERTARVYFPGDRIMSGWLKVVKAFPFIPEKGTEQRTEVASGGSGYSAFAEHSHKLTITPWMPNINDTVLCVYDESFNGDGFILGAL